MVAFILWILCALGLAAIGIYALLAKEAVHFWTVDETIKVSDVKKYNHAVAILWIGFAIVFGLLGIPLLVGQNVSILLISIIGTVVLCILFMVIYTMIEKKYRIML